MKLALRHAGHASPGKGLDRWRGLLARRARRQLRDERGVASIEFAFVLPFLLIVMLGATEMFLMSMASRKMTRVTSTVGDLITQTRGDLRRSDIHGYFQAARHIMGKFPTERLALSVFTYTWDWKSRRPKLSWKINLGGYTCRGNAPRLTGDQIASMRDGNDIVITYGCYRYLVQVGRFVLGNRTLNMEDEITLRPRQRMKVECRDCSS